MRVAFYTLGCKVNQFESWAMAEQFESQGCQIVDWKDEADIYVVNTCAVTSKAAYQSRQMLNRLKRQRPSAKIIATGCHVQTQPAMIIESVGSGICLAGNEQKPLIASMSLKHKGCTGIFISEISKVKQIGQLLISRPPRGRTRAFVKIQDGCNAFCSYCIVPYARGRSRSLPPELVFKQVSDLSDAGVKEIVLTGIHIGFYGRDLGPGVSLFSLLKDLCPAFPHMRFRLSSIEATEVTDEFIVWASETENFCKHFHIPLQSGSAKVLKDMNRGYSPGDFQDLVFKIKKHIPLCGVGTDIMTGFPTETEADFHETLALVERIPISYLHAFPYSPRPGTVASAMASKSSRKEAKERARHLIALGKQKKERFCHRLLGSFQEVLVEKKIKKGALWTGKSSNYMEVLVEADQDLAGSIVSVRISKTRDRVLIGTP